MSAERVRWKDVLAQGVFTGALVLPSAKTRSDVLAYLLFLVRYHADFVEGRVRLSSVPTPAHEVH